MNKFLVFDKELNIYRLPLAYSLGDLDHIRNLFGEHSVDASIALPKLPPHRDVMDTEGNLGYLVSPPREFSVQINDFLEKTVVHVRELKGKGYDFQHPMFKTYLDVRERCINYLAERLESVIDQERRLGIFNIFWLTITKQSVHALNEVLIKVAGSQKLRYLIHPHLKSMLVQVLEQVYEKLAVQDNVTRQNIPFYRDTLKSKLGENFNFNFVRDMLDVQLSLLENSMPPLDPLFQIRKILVEENAEYYLGYKDFFVFYEAVYSWLEDRIAHGDEWILFQLSNILGLPKELIPKMNLNTIIFDPKVIFVLQEMIKQIGIRTSQKGFSIRKHSLWEMLGQKVWNHVLLDFVKLARELQKAEIVTWFRDRIMILGSEYQRLDDNGRAIDGLDDRIIYNFNEGILINDLRKTTLCFIDLRGFTQVSSTLIAIRKLKESLYSFFDPTLDVLDHFKGQIRFFAGDAILAIFGENMDKQERNMNAIRAGIIIQRMLRHLIKEKRLPFEGVGIGIHVGQVEDAYIFKNRQEKIDTVIGLPANVASRLSSGKSIMTERKGDPAMIREINDLLQDILESAKGKVPQNLVHEIIAVFESKMARYSGERTDADVYVPLPESRMQAGQFKVTILGGVLNNNGIAISEDCFKEIRSSHDLRSRPRGENIEFVHSDSILNEDIIFSRVGDAMFKGIEGSMSIWTAYPAKG